MDFQKVREAEVARDNFLKEHPELAGLRKEIDKRLASAGNKENRMALLRAMIDGKCYELSQVCQGGQKVLQENFPELVSPQGDKDNK